ncbi:MAG: hypothetical protein AMXMBFR45_05550 [Gammaproteobacteria bacterium]|nr:MAG: hypothetical protein BroJett010_20470 [Gammaproteobacteria bacterium]
MPASRIVVVVVIAACLHQRCRPPEQRVELDVAIEETAGDAAITNLDALGAQPARLLPEPGGSGGQGDAARGVDDPVPGHMRRALRERAAHLARAAWQAGPQRHLPVAGDGAGGDGEHGGMDAPVARIGCGLLRAPPVRHPWSMNHRRPRLWVSARPAFPHPGACSMVDA